MRKERYNQKLNELEDRIEFLETNLSWKEEFLNNRILRKACYKEFQEAVEIVSDILAMIVKDSEKPVEDDYSNIEIVDRIVGLKETKDVLKRSHGLRNVLVHEYNGIDDVMAFESMNECIKGMKKFVKKVKEWLKKT